jgi:uncharacterized RDD family membrane protein YckC
LKTSTAEDLDRAQKDINVSYPPGPSAPQNPYGHPQQQPAQPQPGAIAKSSYASWGARVGASLIDWLIVGLIPTILIGIGYTQFISHAVHNLQTCQDQNTTTCPAAVQFDPGTALLIYGGALLALIGGLWLAYREGKTGCTPGKKALRIKLVRESTGQPVGFGLAFGRRLLHVLDGLPCYIGYLWPLWDAKRQTFADKIVSTIVVKSH